MSIQRKLVLFAIFCSSFSLTKSEVLKKSFKGRRCPFELKTTGYAKQAVLTTIQSLDHLIYPALCVAAGRSVYVNYLQPFTPGKPSIINTVENSIPGGNTAFSLATYLAVGSALLLMVQTLTDFQIVDDFMQTHTPNSAQLISFVKQQFSQKNTAPYPSNGYIIRG